MKFDLFLFVNVWITETGVFSLHIRIPLLNQWPSIDQYNGFNFLIKKHHAISLWSANFVWYLFWNVLRMCQPIPMQSGHMIANLRIDDIYKRPCLYCRHHICIFTQLYLTWLYISHLSGAPNRNILWKWSQITINNILTQNVCFIIKKHLFFTC